MFSTSDFKSANQLEERNCHLEEQDWQDEIESSSDIHSDSKIMPARVATLTKDSAVVSFDSHFVVLESSLIDCHSN